MNFEIKQVHVDSDVKQERSITMIKLGNETIETILQVVDSLDRVDKYYFSDSNDVVTEIGQVHPTDGNPFIQTKSGQATHENLLSLSKF